ncbi:hypothetical protein [Anaerotignum sp.]|uniref:hypothetical protein n=1 Tax=Anaerotignum sp. TaxID=2039241 RepID=UPI00289A3442|nr:hypothetical protein [Anaerotignum sp.]
MDLNKLRYDLALIAAQISLMSDETKRNYDTDINGACSNTADAFGAAYKMLNSYSDEQLLTLINK